MQKGKAKLSFTSWPDENDENKAYNLNFSFHFGLRVADFTSVARMNFAGIALKYHCPEILLP